MEQQRTYRIELTGVTDLLMHNDNLSWAEKMKAWGTNPANKALSVAGDDRTPAHRWLGNLYTEAGQVVIPADNLMTVIREGGKRCPTGKGQSTFKAQSQSGLMVNESAWPILINGKPVPTAKLEALEREPDFGAHESAAHAHGFTLFVKRAKIGAAKHVRVRPRFSNWSTQGTITVFDPMLTTSVVENIWLYAGTYAGLGDWRPSSPKSPGPFGKFIAKVTQL